MGMRRLLACILAAWLLPVTALAGEAPYYTMTETFDGQTVYSQIGYLPDETFREFGDLALKRPADLFVDEQDRLFISDEGNDRVIMATADGQTLRIFGEEEFKEPGGIFVRNGKLYAADSRLEEVLVFDTGTGELVFRLAHPQTPLYGVNAKFEPLKVAVDDAGSIYVISKGNTNGIAQFSADGAFLGYFGANDTDLSLMEKLQRLTYTQEQLEQLKRVVPPTPTSLDMDTHNLIYTVTAGVSGMKRLNMAGRNIMDPTNQGFDNAVDIVVGVQENIYLINEQGFIMEFTRDGRMLFLFGGQDNDRTRTGLFVATVAIDVDSRGRLYVLDRDKELVQRFAITDYAALVHEALALYQDGRYAESREPWEQVLALNSMFDYAQMGLGRAYYKLEMYDEALTASRLGGDKDGYSDSFWEVRNVWLQEHIIAVLGCLVALAVLRALWKRLRVRWSPTRAVANGFHRVGQVPLLAQLHFITYFPRNPADAFYGVKYEKKVSVLSATLLYIALVVIFIVNKYSCAFLFKTVRDGQFDVGMDLALVVGGIALFLIACNLICSIRDGEGTFKQMYCALAYALGPYILLTPLRFVLTFVLTYNEAFLISLVDLVAAVLCLVLIVMMVKSLQDYSFSETFVTLLLTLFTMLMIVIALIIAAALVAQLWEFVSAVWKEAIFYNES